MAGNGKVLSPQIAKVKLPLKRRQLTSEEFRQLLAPTDRQPVRITARGFWPGYEGAAVCDPQQGAHVTANEVDGFARDVVDFSALVRQITVIDLDDGDQVVIDHGTMGSSVEGTGAIGVDYARRVEQRWSRLPGLASLSLTAVRAIRWGVPALLLVAAFLHVVLAWNGAGGSVVGVVQEAWVFLLVALVGCVATLVTTRGRLSAFVAVRSTVQPFLAVRRRRFLTDASALIQFGSMVVEILGLFFR